MKITALTCTGDRPEAFALCEKYMASQTQKPSQWIVLDDGETPTKCTMGQQYVYCPEFKGKGSMANKVKMAVASGLITGDAVALIEDDDYYAPEWLAWCALKLEKNELVGEGRAIYYNVEQRTWFPHENLGHASLCATAVKRSLFPLLERECAGEDPFIDSRIWRDAKGNGRKILIGDPNGRKRYVVGMKAMPGRKGYGNGHTGQDKSAKADPNLAKLRELIGDAADNYAVFGAKPAPAEEVVEEWADAPVTPKPAPVITETDRVHGPNWRKWLAHLKDRPGVVGVELGVFKGESSQWMMDNIFTHPESIYYSVDTFAGSDEHRLRKIDVSGTEAEARARLAGYKQSKIVKSESHLFLHTRPVGVDFVYIDAAHDTMNVLRDAVLSFDLLAPGGVIVFDDYLWEGMPTRLDLPKAAIDAFLDLYSRHLTVLQPRGWQIGIVKK